ncbi:enoyl-CoA hydratase-related protein [Virgibacillus salarius]|uniref:enoyl-CoA hydratase-related protein n=1 Tax=Virgibacillus salarius TaxID=447199 RepID=UPI002491F1B7|nr:enoyl-CoA hydratase-related protein [Virgibacillus salarius]WBX80890.1 enoyl-CoA hydratase-related protein [Virgibacillus salarius]
MTSEYINTYTIDKVGVIQLFRPNVANALNRLMVKEIVEQLEHFDHNSSVRVILLKGNEKAFAAGADIGEMLDDSPLSLEMSNPFADWDRIRLIKKPIIAAVEGLALGGGFELALHCDLVVAGENATFGFPEVSLGVMLRSRWNPTFNKSSGHSKSIGMDMAWKNDPCTRSTRSRCH